MSEMSTNPPTNIRFIDNQPDSGAGPGYDRMIIAATSAMFLDMGRKAFRLQASGATEDPSSGNPSNDFLHSWYDHFADRFDKTAKTKFDLLSARGTVLIADKEVAATGTAEEDITSRITIGKASTERSIDAGGARSSQLGSTQPSYGQDQPGFRGLLSDWESAIGCEVAKVSSYNEQLSRPLPSDIELDVESCYIIYYYHTLPTYWYRDVDKKDAEQVSAQLRQEDHELQHQPETTDVDTRADIKSRRIKI